MYMFPGDDDVYMPPGPCWAAARYWPVLSDAIDSQLPEGADVSVQILPYPPNTIMILVLVSILLTILVLLLTWWYY